MLISLLISLIREGDGYCDAAVKPVLVRQRVLHFFPKP